jgi:polysaccharide biosynthesis PFTS motif protein
MISEASVVVSFPFSSPNYIAEMMRVPCCWYDPTSEAKSISDYEPDMDFVSGVSDLRKYIFARAKSWI